MNKVFIRQKLASQSKFDQSRKGSIDHPIRELVQFINEHPSYFTTSSCSGRIYVFEDGPGGGKKKGCHWLFTSHDVCCYKDVAESLKTSTADACIKFEPFVLHVQCCSIQAAQKLVEVAVASGFRNSGMTIGRHGKIIAAVRSTHGLEAPLTQAGMLLVDDKYIEYTVRLSSTKMIENIQRIYRFYTSLKTALLSETSAVGSTAGSQDYSEDDFTIQCHRRPRTTRHTPRHPRSDTHTLQGVVEQSNNYPHSNTSNEPQRLLTSDVNSMNRDPVSTTEDCVTITYRDPVSTTEDTDTLDSLELLTLLFSL